MPASVVQRNRTQVGRNRPRLSSYVWLFRHVSLPHLRQHRLRTFLSILGIAAGVSAIVATTVVTKSAFRSFERVVEVTSAGADLHVTNGGAGVPDAVVEKIRAVEGVRFASPFIESVVQLDDGSGDTMTVFGLDVLADPRWRDEFHDLKLEIPDEAAFIAQPDSVLVPRAFANERGRALGDELRVIAPLGRQTLVIRGFVAAGDVAELFPSGVALMDLAAAQLLLARTSLVDRVDIHIEDSASSSDVRTQIENIVAGVGRVEDPAVYGRRPQDLLRTMRVVLAQAATMAIVVGFFVIYHTAVVSTAQRRKEILTMYALGIPVRGLRTWLVLEAGAMGAFAAAVGIVAGVALGHSAFAAFDTVTATWIRMPAAEFVVPVSSVCLAFLVGVGTCMLAVGVASRAYLRPGDDSPLSKHGSRNVYVRSGRRTLTLAAICGLCAAALIVVAPASLPFRVLTPYVLMVGVLILVGFGLCGPSIAVLLGRLARHRARSSTGTTLLVAGSALSSEPEGSIAVIAAIVLAMGWTLGDAAFVNSARRTWLDWLDEHRRYDFVVLARDDVVLDLTAPPISEDVAKEISQVEGVATVQGYRFVEGRLRGRPIVIEAIDEGERRLPVVGVPWEALRTAFWQGRGVLVSSNLAQWAEIAPGSEISLDTPSGNRKFKVLGEMVDLTGGDLGSVVLTRSLYRELWQDSLVSQVAVWAIPGADLERLHGLLSKRASEQYGGAVVRFADVRRQLSELIDNAFAGTYALVLVAFVVSFIGIVNFLLSCVLDRREWFRVLHAVGLKPRELRAIIVAEGSLLGAASVATGTIAGVVVSRMIVHFTVPLVTGWHFTYTFPLGMACGLALGSLVLAAGAGCLPAFLATRRKYLAEVGIG